MKYCSEDDLNRIQKMFYNYMMQIIEGDVSGRVDIKDDQIDLYVEHKGLVSPVEDNVTILKSGEIKSNFE